MSSTHCSNEGSFDINSVAKFKDDLVVSLGQIEDTMRNRCNSFETMLSSKISAFEIRLIEADSAIKSLNAKINQLVVQQEKYLDLGPLQKKINENLISQEIRINNLSKEISNACYKYDKIFLDNLVLPGQIGEFCRFKNLRDCLMFILDHTSQMNSYKDRSSIEFRQVKEKLEKNLKAISTEVTSSKDSIINYVKERNNLFEKGLRDEIKSYLELVNETKIENSKHLSEYKQFSIELKKEMNAVLQVKDDVIKSNLQVASDVKSANATTMENFAALKNEFNKINRHFLEVVEFIRDVRFKRNLNTEVSKNDIKKLAQGLLDNKGATGKEDEHEDNKNEVSYNVNNTIVNKDVNSNVNNNDNILPIKEVAKNAPNSSNLALLKLNPKLRNKPTVTSNKTVSDLNTSQLVASDMNANFGVSLKKIHSKKSLKTLVHHNTLGNVLRKPIVEAAAVNRTNLSFHNELIMGHREGKSLPKFKSRKMSIISRNNSESKDKKRKQSKTRSSLNAYTNSSDNSMIDETKQKKIKKEHFIYKLIKNENGSLTKTSSITYFKPKKALAPL